MTQRHVRKTWMVFRCAGRKPAQIEPGGRLRIGRHENNDLVLPHGTVSRFHAEVLWDPDEDRPYIVDQGSSNGVEVDGRFVEERGYLRGGDSLLIGDFRVSTEVRHGSAVTAPTDFLVKDSDDDVRLFSEKGEELRGELAGSSAVHRLFLELEKRKRTGTLTIVDSEAPDAQVEVVLSQGRVITACEQLLGENGEVTGNALQGTDALELACTLNSGSYEFTRRMVPAETEFLNLSLRRFLTKKLKVDVEALEGSALDEDTRKHQLDSTIRSRKETPDDEGGDTPTAWVGSAAEVEADAERDPASESEAGSG